MEQVSSASASVVSICTGDFGPADNGRIDMVEDYPHQAPLKQKPRLTSPGRVLVLTGETMFHRLAATAVGDS